MLKALELVGFKSFADKTRLEFPRGITVVVGPNGSGKSNIVDAIKWVLGEQSVKSLRGKEMADVIFNGSATRRALNAAETTLTFDNSQHLLAVDTPEVHVTRRVYRSGEGEYLINRQPCRLRDIRELFAGTGVATEAYSVIEQGKVDVLLQSSPRERRLIFEEAAGISRFKAKKVEALRRLERVEQNLLRLSDIVDEVESRLRAVRLQAGKARRYKEYSDRLQALRTQIGLADWRTLSARLSEAEAELTAIHSEIAVHLAQAESNEAQAVALDGQIVAADAATRASEGRIAQNRERIAAHESAIEHQRRHCHDLEEEIARYRRQLTSMGLRAGDIVQQLRDIVANLAAAELQHRDVARRLAEEERGLTKLTAQIDELRAETEQWRAAHLDQLRGIAALESQIGSLESKVAATRMAQERGAKRLAELIASRDALAAELERLRTSTDALALECHERQTQLEQAQSQLAASRRDASLARDRLGQLRQRHSGASERAAVLEELEKRLEGLSAGVKQVLTQAQGSNQGPFGQIRGLVADLLHVNFETAPLVELALGEMAQCLVVAGGRDRANQLHESVSLAGRVGFIRLDTPAAKTHLDALDLHGHDGVLGRADEFVETAPEFAVLAKRLLGKTWIVESLAHALALSESVGRGVSFVTRAGEMVAADATLYLGPRHTSTGLISRRSELRILRQQITEMAAEIERHATVCAEFEQTILAQERQVQSLAAEARQLHERHQHERMRRTTSEERQSQLRDLCESLAAELAATTTEHDHAAAVLAESKARLTKVANAQRELEARMSEGAQRAKDLEQVRQRTGREAAATKIDVVKSEQWLSHLRPNRVSSNAISRSGAARWPTAARNWPPAPSGCGRPNVKSWPPNRRWPSFICARNKSPPRRFATSASAMSGAKTRPNSPPSLNGLGRESASSKRGCMPDN
jgi:chromosome segregation protein